MDTPMYNTQCEHDTETPQIFFYSETQTSHIISVKLPNQSKQTVQ